MKNLPFKIRETDSIYIDLTISQIAVWWYDNYRDSYS